MKKNLFFIVLLAVLFAACGGSQKPAEQNTTDQDTVAVAPVEVSIAEFISNTGDIVGKEIVIEGTVNHVCQHGGKRMFLIDTASQETVKVVTGENLASFNTDLEGTDVIVKGIVEELRIDEAYLVEWEKELAENETQEHGDGHGEGEKGEAADQGEHIAAIEQIEKYRNQIAESGNDHLSFYSVICTSYEVKNIEE